MKTLLRSLVGLFSLVLVVGANAQNVNLLESHHGDFQESDESSWLYGDDAVSSQYEYDKSYHGLQNGGVQNGSGKFSVTAQAQNANASYYNCTGHPSGHNNEKFLAVNGFGGDRDYYTLWNNTPSNKRILRYTLQVEPNILYEFSFWATHLTNGDNTGLPFDPFDGRVKFRVKCNSSNVTYGNNNETVWEPEYVSNTAKWCKSPTYRCFSNSSGQLVITIYDDNVWTSEYGDDFGIDDAELRKSSEYNVTAHSFSVTACNGDFSTTSISLDSHITISQPAGQPNMPTEISIRGNASQSWTATPNVSIITNHGTAYFDNNNKIHYIPDDAYAGDDQILYRVQKYGLSSEKTITLHVQGAPTNVQVTNFPEDHWCKGDPLNLGHTYDLNGSSVTSERLEWSFSPTGNWNELNMTTFVDIASYVDYYVRYKVVNGCGTAYSDVYQLRVCGDPVLNTAQIAPPNTICEGGSLPSSYLTQVSVTAWNNDEGTSGWEVKRGSGPWQPLSEVTLAQGDKLRYRAENCCGEVATNIVNVSVTAGPEFTQSTPSFDEHYCVGDVLSLSSVSPPNYQANGITISDQYWVRSSDGGVTFEEINGNPVLDMSWDGNWICYRLECPCGTVNSANPYVIHVFDEPVFVEELMPLDGPYCPNDVLLAPEAPAFESYAGTQHGWAISTGTDPNGSYIDLSLPITLSSDHNGKWLKHWANGCSLSYSNAVQIQVNNRPTLISNSIDDPEEICAGVALSLPDAGVISWNGDTIGCGWEIYHNGVWEPYEPGEVLSIDYAGALLRYWAESECGRTDSDPAVISVIQGPEFINPQPLALPPYYCEGDALYLPLDPTYETNGSQVMGYWASSVDNVDYQPINGTITLTEEWSGHYINYLLQSNCGDIRYPYPFQLTIYGTPSVDSIEELKGPFCPKDILPLPDEPAYSNTFDGSTHGWMISDGDDQDGDYQYLSTPFLLNQDDDGRWIRYDVVGCSTGHSNAVQIHVGDKPSLSHMVLSTPDPICDGESLSSSYLNTLYVEDWNQFYSEDNYSLWQIFYNGEWQEMPEKLSIDYNGCLIRYFAHNDCGDTYTSEVILRVMEAPEMDVSITTPICTGQPLDCQTVNLNSAYVDAFLWKFKDSEGNETEFDPDTYQFDQSGVYDVFFAAVNQCNEDHPEFYGPYPLTVVPGPEFQQDPSWPDHLEVCDGQTLADMLNEAGVTEPGLVDPSIAHNLEGWFLKYKDEDNNTQYESIALGQTLTESNYDSEICFGMTGDCSAVPIYSNSILLQVHGQPEIVTPLSMSQNYCSGELFPPGDFDMEINYHHNSCTMQWQWYMNQEWNDISDLPIVLGSEHDGIQVRVKISSADCGFEDNSNPLSIQVASTPEIKETIVTQIGLCGDEALPISVPAVDWHHVTPEEGVWQVSPTINGNYGTGPFGTEGLMFDINQIGTAFDGWYLRYHVEGCNGENNSNAALLTIYESSTVQITGTEMVSVMNSYWPGIYYYYTDVEGVSLNWTLEPEIWQIRDTIIDGKNCCEVVVTTAGKAKLTAAVGDGSCGQDVLYISASNFGVDEQESVNVRLYPNPTDGVLFVKGEEMTGIVIYNLMGQEVKAVSCPMDDLVEADVHDLAPALYVMKVQTKKGNKTLLFSVL